MSAPLLAFDSFGKSFGERTVLYTASLFAWPGRITVLLGRNGSGKSTLIRLGVGLLDAEHGTTRWETEAWTRPSLAALARRGLFYLPDRGLLSRRLSVERQLALYVDRLAARPKRSSATCASATCSTSTSRSSRGGRSVASSSPSCDWRGPAA